MNSLHNVKTDFFSAGTSVTVEKYKFFNVEFDSSSYEGRQRVNFDIEIINEEIILDQEMIYIPTNQKVMRVIVNLLEPQSADSYVRWGFMNQIFERKEYYEEYVMEKLAEEMLANDPNLKREFEIKLKNYEAFRNDSRARLDFFYERSPYYDEQKNVYPILRIVE
jgi:6-pyruvoyl-tetrahydropterin synthase